MRQPHTSQQAPVLDPGDDCVDMIFVGLEIGGTNLKAGVLRQGVLLGNPHSKPIPADESAREPQAIVDLLIVTGKECLAEHNLTWMSALRMGIACPGQIIGERGVVVGASNFPTWKNVPLGSMIEAHSSRPTTVLNDASAAAMAQLLEGGGDKSIAVLTLGTGIGLGLVSGGRVMSGSRGLVEGGHMIVEPGPDARRCGCGQRGCLEAYASATAVAQIATERMGKVRAAARALEKAESRRDSKSSIASKAAKSSKARKPSRKAPPPPQEYSRGPFSVQSTLTPTPTRAAPIFPRAFASKSAGSVRGRVEELEKRASTGSARRTAPPVSPLDPVSPASTPVSPCYPNAEHKENTPVDNAELGGMVSPDGPEQDVDYARDEAIKDENIENIHDDNAKKSTKTTGVDEVPDDNVEDTVAKDTYSEAMKHSGSSVLNNNEDFGEVSEGRGSGDGTVEVNDERICTDDATEEAIEATDRENNCTDDGAGETLRDERTSSGADNNSGEAAELNGVADEVATADATIKGAIAKDDDADSSGKGEDPEGKRTSITAEDVFSMAKDGNEVAMSIVQETSRYLGLACVNICRLIDPNLILLAGGMSQAEGLVDKVREEFLSMGWSVLPHECEISKSSTSAPCFVGVVGAAAAATAEHSRRREQDKLMQRIERMEQISAVANGNHDVMSGSDVNIQERERADEHRQRNRDVPNRANVDFREPVGWEPVGWEPVGREPEREPMGREPDRGLEGNTVNFDIHDNESDKMYGDSPDHRRKGGGDENHRVMEIGFVSAAVVVFAVLASVTIIRRMR